MRGAQHAIDAAVTAAKPPAAPPGRMGGPRSRRDTPWSTIC